MPISLAAPRAEHPAKLCWDRRACCSRPEHRRISWLVLSKSCSLQLCRPAKHAAEHACASDSAALLDSLLQSNTSCLPARGVAEMAVLAPGLPALGLSSMGVATLAPAGAAAAAGTAGTAAGPAGAAAVVVVLGLLHSSQQGRPRGPAKPQASSASDQPLAKPPGKSPRGSDRQESTRTHRPATASASHGGGRERPASLETSCVRTFDAAAAGSELEHLCKEKPRNVDVTFQASKLHA